LTNQKVFSFFFHKMTSEQTELLIEDPTGTNVEQDKTEELDASLGKWIPLTEFPGCEITDSEPWAIRKPTIGGGWKLANFTFNKKLGYYYVCLNKRNSALHRVIAKQFIPNRDNLKQIDHRNRNKTDNSLANLRWATASINSCNKIRIKGVEQLFINDLPEGYTPFTEYTVRPEDVRILPDLFVKWEITYDEDGTQHCIPHFITYDSKYQYRILQPDKRNKKCVKYRDENRKVCSLSYSKCARPAEDEAPQGERAPQGKAPQGKVDA
jgi:hypothetical protein